MPPKVVSGVPSELYRITPNFPLTGTAATILTIPPSMASASPPNSEAWSGAKSVRTIPSPSNVVSRLPFGLSRMSPSLEPTVPLTTIFPSGWMTIAVVRSKSEGIAGAASAGSTSTTTMPGIPSGNGKGPKVGSRSPGAALARLSARSGSTMTARRVTRPPGIRVIHASLRQCPNTCKVSRSLNVVRDPTDGPGPCQVGPGAGAPRARRAARYSGDQWGFAPKRPSTTPIW